MTGSLLLQRGQPSGQVRTVKTFWVCAPSVGKRIWKIFDVINSAIVQRGGRVGVERGCGSRDSQLATFGYVA